MSDELHTQRCVDYAVKTAMNGSGYHCLAECTLARRSRAGKVSDKPANGGPAFPHDADYVRNEPGSDEPYRFLVEHHPGMDLLDYFAGQALEGLLAAQAGKECEDCLAEDHAAAMAYAQADKMLAERERRSDAKHHSD